MEQSMKLKELLAGIENFKMKGDAELEIKSIENNSKNIKPGALFVAIKGFDFDGHKFVEEAIQNGAAAIMLDISADLKSIRLPQDITVILSTDTRADLAKVACNFYKNPSRYFKLIGVTGTKGKTTTTYMIKSILEKAGYKVGLIGTIANYIGEDIISKSHRTTPESLELQELFYKMALEKVDFVVMEVSSQSLKLHRVDGSAFDMAVFTNFSKDHISLKEHTDMEDYFNSKLKLFQVVPKGFANSDDFKCEKLMYYAKNCDIKTYSIDNASNLIAKDITITNASVDFKVKLGQKNERVKVNIPGRYSVYNSLAAISVAISLGIDAEKIKEGLANIVIPGRNELIPNEKELTIMIDYAHTAESLENILNSIKAYTQGRIICVFGCGGDRDKDKRPAMGEVAGRLADFSIVTTDNPRTEKPEDIIKDIEQGIAKTKGNYKIVVDRKEAIKEAIDMANKRDIIILAGKGHETYQEINGENFEFDERKIVKEILKNK